MIRAPLKFSMLGLPASKPVIAPPVVPAVKPVLFFAPSKLKLTLCLFYQLEDNRIKVLEAINEVCKSLKAIKAFLVEDYLWIAIEMFTDSTPELDDFMPRCMQILKTGREMLAQEIFKD